MVDVSTEAVINRPPAEVADYATDPTNAAECYSNIKSVRWETAPPLGVGSRLSFFEVACTGIRGSTGAVQAGSNTQLFKPACTTGILSRSRLHYL